MIDDSSKWTLWLKNWTVFADSGPIPLRPMTLIYGPNGAGKSSIIQGLQCLKKERFGPTSSNYSNNIRDPKNPSTLMLDAGGVRYSSRICPHPLYGFWSSSEGSDTSTLNRIQTKGVVDNHRSLDKFDQSIVGELSGLCQGTGFDKKSWETSDGARKIKELLSITDKIGNTYCYEHPDRCLHPKVQLELTSALCKMIAPPFKHRFVIETHSELIAHRVRKLIRQGLLKPADVSILYVFKGDQESHCLEMRLDLDGEFIDCWPEDNCGLVLDELS